MHTRSDSSLKSWRFIVLLFFTMNNTRSMEVYLYTNAANFCAFCAGSMLMSSLKLSHKKNQEPLGLLNLLGSGVYTLGTCTMLAQAVRESAKYNFNSGYVSIFSSTIAGTVGFFSTAFITWYFKWHKRKKNETP